MKYSDNTIRRLFLLAVLSVLLLPAYGQYASGALNRAERVVRELHDPHSDYVVVVAHRGDWRNYPENSLPAIESVIRMGGAMWWSWT